MLQHLKQRCVEMYGHELAMCEEVSGKEVVVVMKCLKSGISSGSEGIMNKM